MVDFHHVRTDSLSLHPISNHDTDDLYSLNSNPKVWEHLPSGRHTSREQTEQQVSKETAAWDRDGHGYWVAKMPDESFAGVGGCGIKDNIVWNIYYRFLPKYQGKGLATEIARAGLEAAQAIRPDIPITAFLLENNLASKAVAEKLGLELAWRGPDAGNPDPEAIRLIYADRKLAPDVLDFLIAQ